MFGRLILLSIYIDNAWEPSDFVKLFQSVESMYYKINARKDYRALFRDPYFWDEHLFSEREFAYERSYIDKLDRINRLLAERARYHTMSRDKLIVRRIHYASPGGIDLLGLGKACDSIANAIGRMVSYYDKRHLRREKNKQFAIKTKRKTLELEKERETIRALKIRNARDMLELERDFPDETREILLPLLVRGQDALSDRIADGRLIGAEAKKEQRRPQDSRKL